MAEIITNTYELTQAARAREEFLAGFVGSLDAKRPDAWRQYGYKTDLCFSDYRQAYERGGPAHGAVHKILGKCWEQLPRIKQPEADKATPWEEAITALLRPINGWQKLMGFDRRNLVGRFSALIYRVADGRPLSEPLSKGDALKDLIPLYEDQIKVTDWHDDQDDPDTYGKPRMFQYRARSASSTGDIQAKPEMWADVHPSRVQILAEGADGDDFFEGVPLLKAGFNALVDLEKLRGGGAESALKNSARTVVFQYDAAANPQEAVQASGGDPKEVKALHEERAKAINRNQDAAIVMQGGTATTLQTQASDLSPQWTIAANEFSASVGLPFTVLFGQQTGRLASDEDQKDYIARAVGRQLNTLTPMLTEFVQRMQACGIIAAGEFEIEWPDLGAPSDEQRLDNAVKMVTANKTAYDGGSLEPIFDLNEIRKVGGFEERAAGAGDEFKEETPPVGPAADPNADPAAASKTVPGGKQ
ncbi:DUF1073 domain-containing protein [Roseateles sp. SL47]|uniref:anti-CBASS protein Acb1 family protein n=1 Tax=Roseateles sp. SL47 TaxID=2995138 RepID=UPI0022702241|nr:anti-CBASS Acb1 family protein [Roseateles sp. SL47]WAC75354.1 DUF1073 domain-containing protein [Roseateles sp. SL47]